MSCGERERESERGAVQKGRGAQIYDMTASEDRQTHLLLISIPHLCSDCHGREGVETGERNRELLYARVCVCVCGGHFSLKAFFCSIASRFVFFFFKCFL